MLQAILADRRWSLDNNKVRFDGLGVSDVISDQLINIENLADISETQVPQNK